MREIKFRAWDEKRMINNIGVHPNISMVHEGYEGNEDGAMTISPRMTSYSIMQFTGWKDSKNKDIYEGDLISENGSAPYEVIWQSHAGQWIMQSVLEGRGYRKMAFDYAQQEYVVIGNKFQNPELLNT